MKLTKIASTNVIPVFSGSYMIAAIISKEQYLHKEIPSSRSQPEKDRNL